MYAFPQTHQKSAFYICGVVISVISIFELLLIYLIFLPHFFLFFEPALFLFISRVLTKFQVLYGVLCVKEEGAELVDRECNKRSFLCLGLVFLRIVGREGVRLYGGGSR